MTESAGGAQQSLPDGIVTFLLTDIEESSRLWELYSDSMRLAVARHEEIIEEVLAQYKGVRVKRRGEGDSHFVVFADPVNAVLAMGMLQWAFLAEPWPDPIVLRVRAALHTGMAELRDDDYFGQVINRCARLRGIAHGGQTLLSQSTADLVRGHLSQEYSLRDMDRHSLKDLLRPEHVFQLCHPQILSDFPPLRSLTSRPNNLPLQLTSFIGREQEMEQIGRLLGETRLLTLLGSGGSGKTRLALQAAAERADDFPDGVWQVELAPISEPLAPVQAVASVFNVHDELNLDSLSRLTEALRTKSLLLVLDNCEHQLEQVVPLVEALLKTSPGIHILATSRQALQVTGEVTWHVPSFPLPDPKALPSFDSIVRNDAVRLFTERAQAVAPAFQLTQANIEDVVRICHRVDGMPFGLEMAAAKVPMLTVRNIATRLERSFRDLTSNSTTRIPRHRSMHALIGWSYDLLAEPERVLLRRLSLFSGGWTLDAAEAICGDEDESLDVFDAMTNLERASLVVVEERNENYRYRLLESVREYARNRLTESGEEKAFQARHLHFFLGLAEEAEPHLTRREQAVWLNRLEDEHDNLRAASSALMESGIRLRLALSLWRFWAMRGYLSEGAAWLSDALSTSSEISPAVRAKALLGLGVLAARQGDFGTARQHLEMSLHLRREQNDQQGIADTLINLGNMLREQGDYVTAQERYEECLLIRQAAGDVWGTSGVLNNLGMTARDQPDFPLARSYYERSLTICRQQGNAEGIARALANLGVVYADEGNYLAAQRSYEESLLRYREIGHPWSIAVLLHNLGQIATHQGLFVPALRDLQEALTHQVALNDSGGAAQVLRSLGVLALTMRQFERAATLLGAAEAARETLGMTLRPNEQREHEAEIQQIRDNMDAEAFTQAWRFGTILTGKQRIACALQSGEELPSN